MSAEDRKPGSWVVHHDEYAVGIGEVRNDGTSLNFADLHVGQFLGDHDRAMKKARLIAAAPDLLAALQEVRSDGPLLRAGLGATIDAAIAKATGAAA